LILIIIVDLCDLQYQNKSDIVAATWHGFTDIESGIVQYLWCVGTDNQNCDTLPWTPVGMHTSVSAKIQPRTNGKLSILNSCILTCENISFFPPELLLHNYKCSGYVPCCVTVNTHTIVN
jgi:hypothetical protein